MWVLLENVLLRNKKYLSSATYKKEIKKCVSSARKQNYEQKWQTKTNELEDDVNQVQRSC